MTSGTSPLKVFHLWRILDHPSCPLPRPEKMCPMASFIRMYFYTKLRVCVFFFSGHRDEVPPLAVSLFDDSSHLYCSCSCSATCLIRKRWLKVLGRSSQSQGQPNNQRHFQACQVITKAVRFMIFWVNKILIDTYSKILITIRIAVHHTLGKYTYLQLHKIFP